MRRKETQSPGSLGRARTEHGGPGPRSQPSGTRGQAESGQREEAGEKESRLGGSEAPGSGGLGGAGVRNTVIPRGSPAASHCHSDRCSSGCVHGGEASVRLGFVLLSSCLVPLMPRPAQLVGIC